jgi:hypothetical protein
MAMGILALGLSAPGSSSRAAEPQAAAASALKLSGSFRIRQENLEGQYRPGFTQSSDDMLALRASLLAEWTSGPWKLAGEISDSRAFETHDGGVLSANEVNTFEPVQAYVSREFAAPFGKGSSLTLQAGRFLMNLGSRRLVASDEFRNTPQGSTGVRTDLRLASKAQLTAFYVLPQQRRPDDAASLRDNDFELDHSGRDQQLWGVVGSKPALLPGGALGELTYVRFLEQDHGARPTRNRALHSIGVRAIRDPKADQFDYEIEGILQTGHIRASTAVNAVLQDVDAFFVHGDAGYTFSSRGKPRLSLEYDYASGDGPGTEYQRFDTLFGMRRADLAPSGIYGLLGRANLESLGVRVEATGARLDAMASWRLLWAADARDSFSTSGVRDASGAAGRRAGSQFDGRLRYWLMPARVRAEVNAIWFNRAGLMRHAPNASAHGDTIYFTTAITLTF